MLLQEAFFGSTVFILFFCPLLSFPNIFTSSGPVTASAWPRIPQCFLTFIYLLLLQQLQSSPFFLRIYESTHIQVFISSWFILWGIFKLDLSPLQNAPNTNLTKNIEFYVCLFFIS